jgi:hypothetical protein
MQFASEPESRHLLGALHQPRRSLLSADQDTTPAALSPFRRQNPREEPGALAALAGICAGGGEQSLSRDNHTPLVKQTGILYSLNVAHFSSLRNGAIGNVLSC